MRSLSVVRDGVNSLITDQLIVHAMHDHSRTQLHVGKIGNCEIEYSLGN